MASFEDGTVDSGGVAIAVRDWGGDGPPILLIHGNGLSLASFDAMVPHLLESHRVVGMDIRRQGRSADGPFTWEAALADTAQVVAHFGLEDPSLVGHSLGGMIAALYGGTGAPCRAAVNLDGHGLGIGVPADDPDEIEARRRMKALSDSAVAAHYQPIPAEVIDTQLAALPTEQRDQARENALRMFTELPDGSFQLRVTRAATEEVMAAVNAIDLFDIYRKCLCPLLIVNAVKENPAPGGAAAEIAEIMGQRRPVLSANLRTLATEAPNVEVLEVDATHNLIAEIPEELAKTISTFVHAAPGPRG